jgi:hypothetical protein
MEGILWQRMREPFVYPVPPAPRTAVLVNWFRTNLLPAQAVRIFPRGWETDAAQFEPAAIAATIDQFRKLSGVLIPSLTHALIVLERPGSPRLTETDRTLFWRAFRVPVFEQIIGPFGQLLAFECEAHEGLHIEAPGLQLTEDMIESRPCPCGRETARFGVRGIAEVERRAAAYAR